MLQENGSSYDCFVKETQQQDFTECTVLLRRKTTSDQIIEKQAALLQKVKHDNELLKRFLERKTVEMGKMKLCIDALQAENQQLKNHIEGIARQRGSEHNQQLNHENEELRQKIACIQAEEAKTAIQREAEIMRLQQDIQNLNNENEFLQKMNKQNEHLQKIEVRCRQLEIELERERKNGEQIKTQQKVTEFIKIDGQPQYEQTDYVKNSLDFGEGIAKKSIPANECEISAVRSRNSDRLFQDCEGSYESEGEKGKSASYQKSEAEIQTERCEIYGSTMLSREKIEKSLRRDNHHMKPMDQYTRIMNLSKELNEKEQTIKELQKKVEREKKNSESVKSKLKEREKELKQIKKNKSLKREILIEDQQEKAKTENKKEEENKEKDSASNNETREITEEKIEQTVKEIEEAVKVEAKNIVIIEESKEMNEVNVQTQEEKDDIAKIKQEIELLRVENLALKSAAKGQARQEQEYEEEKLRISVTAQYDSQSEEEAGEVAVLRAEAQALRAKIKDLEEMREEIPFEEVEEAREMKEVVMQTEDKQPDATEHFMQYLQGLKLESKQYNEEIIEDEQYQQDKQANVVNEVLEQMYFKVINDVSKDQKVEMTEQLLVQCKQLNEINVQTDIVPEDKSIKDDCKGEQKAKERDLLYSQLQLLKQANEQLHMENNSLKEQLQAKQTKRKQLQEEYLEDNLRISITAQHDSQSEEEVDENAILKAEVMTLKARLREIEEMREEIPFEEVEEVKEMRQVVVQTEQRQANHDASDTLMDYISGLNLQGKAQEDNKHLPNEETKVGIVNESIDQLYSKVAERVQSQQLPEKTEDKVNIPDEELKKLREENQILQIQNTNMKQLFARQERQARVMQRQEEEYKEENLRISITEQHDSESEEEVDETTILKTQISALKARVKELQEQREQIPFEEVQEEKELKEVVMQTEDKAAAEGQSEPNDLMNYLVGFNDVNVVVDGGAQQQYDMFVEEKQFAQVSIQTCPEEKVQNQEQQIRHQGNEAETEPVLQMKGLRRVKVHPIRQQDESANNIVLIGRRNRHQAEEENGNEANGQDKTTVVEERESKEKMQEQLKSIKQEIELLQAENLALKSAAKGQARQEQEYEEENLRISVSAQYDSQSEEEAGEVAVLRAEAQALRAKIKDLEEMREEIPFEEVEEAREMKEVVMQTEDKQPDATEHFMQYLQGLKLDNKQEQKDLLVEQEHFGQNYLKAKGLGDQRQQEQEELLLFDDPEQKGYAFVSQGSKQQYNPKIAKLSIQQHIQLHIPREAETSSILMPSTNEEKTAQFEIQEPVAQQVKNLTDSIETPKFEASSRSLYSSSENLKFLEAFNRPKEHSEGICEQLALKNQQIFALNEKLAWIEQKLAKYKRIISKYRQKSEEVFEEIEVEQQQMILIEVETQTNPLFINDMKDSLERRCEVVESRLQEEQRVNFGLRSKLKRWQNMMKKINYNNISEESMQDLEELEIQEENIQLCEVEVQVNLGSIEDFDKNEDIGMRQEIKQTSRIFLNKIENLKQKWIGEDSEENSSQNYSDRGKNTKRSVGSDEEEKLKKEKLLQMQISHLYKDIHHLFKKHHYKAAEQISIDNFKEELQAFIQFIKNSNNKAKYNSFEDIKEQSNDDSANSRNTGGNTKVESQPFLSELDASNKECIKKEIQGNQADTFSGLKILFIQHESILTKTKPNLELNPLVIKEVSYHCLSAQTVNEVLLQLMKLSSSEIETLIEGAQDNLRQLREKVSLEIVLGQQLLEEILEVCGANYISRLLNL